MATPEEMIRLLQEQLSALQINQDRRAMAVSVKLPAFWADKPTVWFGQAEAQFELAGIKQDRTKYSHIVAMLDARVAGEVADIIEQPPETDCYQHLKTELIKRLSASREDRVRRLLGEEDIGDRKPSQFLRHLRSLAGSVFQSDDLIRQLWMRRLPANVQAILAAQDDLVLEKAADIADKIVEVAVPVSVHAVGAPSSELSELARRVDHLTKIVEGLSAADRPSRSRTRNNSNNSRSTSRSASQSSLCWYHRVYKMKANKCAQPCSWESTEN